MKKLVTFKPGFDKRNPDPNKNCGIHGMEIRFTLKNYKGAVQFILFTNWLPTTGGSDLKWFEKILPTETKDAYRPMFVTLLINPFIPSTFLKPFPADIGYHSPKPIYDEQKTVTEECELLGGKPCYYDGSGLNAIRIFEVLLNEGDEGIWRELQNYHEYIFGEGILKKSRKKINGLVITYLKFTGVDKSVVNIKNAIDSIKKKKENKEEKENKEGEIETRSNNLKLGGDAIALIISISGIIGTIIALSIILSGGKI